MDFCCGKSSVPVAMARLTSDEACTGLLPIGTLEGQHKRMKESLKLSADAMIHSFRHTLGTRLSEVGAEAFTIMKAMGQSSVVVFQKYVRPTPQAMERTVEHSK
jgi:integrase